MTRREIEQLHKGIAHQNQSQEKFEEDLAGLGMVLGLLFFLIVVAVIGTFGVF